MKRSRQHNGFAPGEKFYQRKGEDGKYESRFQDPPRDYGTYVRHRGKKRSAPPGLQWLCLLSGLGALPTAPWKGLSPPLKPISEYIKGNLTEDLLLNSVLALLHQPRRERTLSISLTTAVRKPPTES